MATNWRDEIGELGVLRVIQEFKGRIIRGELIISKYMEYTQSNIDLAEEVIEKYINSLPKEASKDSTALERAILETQKMRRVN